MREGRIRSKKISTVAFGKTYACYFVLFAHRRYETSDIPEELEDKLESSEADAEYVTRK